MPDALSNNTASGIIGKHLERSIQKRTNAAESHNGKVAPKQSRFEDEGWRIRKEGSRSWGNVIIGALRDKSGKLVAFGKVTREFHSAPACLEFRDHSRGKMPFKSKAQRRKFAQLLVEGKISDQTFEEWNRETGTKKLPQRVGAKTARKKTKSKGKK